MKLVDTLALSINEPKFVLNNVADYYFNHEKEYWALNDFPLPRPPFDKMWFEYKMPKTCWSKEAGKTDFMINDYVSVFFGGVVQSAEVEGRKAWVLSGSFWGVPNHGGDVVPGARQNFMFSLDDENKIIPFVEHLDDMTEDQVNMEASKLYAFHPVLMSFSFCNCKNVEVVTVRASQRLQRARQRKGKKPIKEHKIINILPFGKYFERGSRVVTMRDGNGDRLVREIRRGSYARYGPEFNRGLLFGKYSGMFWRPAILKDSDKEYQIRQVAEAHR